jgi:hypothetical protein
MPACSRTRGLCDRARIPGLVALTSNLALLAVELARFRVCASQPGAEIPRGAVGQSQRIEAQKQFAFAFDPPGTLPGPLANTPQKMPA